MNAASKTSSAEHEVETSTDNPLSFQERAREIEAEKRVKRKKRERTSRKRQEKKRREFRAKFVGPILLFATLLLGGVIYFFSNK